MECWKECKTRECEVIEGFLECYNVNNNTKYKMISCPDKDELKQSGKKPDGIAQDIITLEKMAIELKQIYHSEGEGDRLRTKENNRNQLYHIISQRMNEIININNLDIRFMVTIYVYEPIGRKYLERIASVEFVKEIEKGILSEECFEYEDEKVKIEIRDNPWTENWMQEAGQVIFSFPTCQEKGKENGMSFAEIFNMIEDYESIVNDVEGYIKTKCEGKFNNYTDAKRIILFELRFKFGMDIMLKVNDITGSTGFSLDKLRNRYQNQIGQRLSEYADEVWIIHIDDKTEEESLVRMISLT